MKVWILLVGLVSLVSLGVAVYVGRMAPAPKVDAHGHGDSHGPGEEGDHKDEHVEGHSEGVVKMASEELEKMGVKLEKASGGQISTEISMQGSLEAQPDSVAHVVPRMQGVVKEVRKKLGDSVKKGETLAVIESRDLADIKTAWLAAREKRTLASSAFKREEELFNKKIVSEQDYLSAKKELSAAQIEYDGTKQKIQSLGLDPEQIAEPGASLVRFDLKAPLKGVVVERHLTVGETTKEAEPAFVIAELSKVLAVLQIYPKDLPFVKVGLKAKITLSGGLETTEGQVLFLSPILDAQTRSANAHVMVDNASGNFRPGLFVNANISLGAAEAALLVSRKAMQKVEGKEVIFVQTDEGFIPSPIEIGKSNSEWVEVLSGLEPEETYVSEGSFLLKAELAKSEAAHEH
jgi:cobalt-zinc-cadmium efflux system membrane fusion protein